LHVCRRSEQALWLDEPANAFRMIPVDKILYI